MRPLMRVVFAAAMIPTLTLAASTFSTSLKITAPGPHAERAGLTYSLALSWESRPGAVEYRTFMWTDAVGAWYPVAKGTGTTSGVHAFRSGCTAFVVIAVANTVARANSMAGIDTSNIVQFPLSLNPNLCPHGKP